MYIIFYSLAKLKYFQSILIIIYLDLFDILDWIKDKIWMRIMEIGWLLQNLKSNPIIKGRIQNQHQLKKIESFWCSHYFHIWKDNSYGQYLSWICFHFNSSMEKTTQIGCVHYRIYPQQIWMWLTSPLHTGPKKIMFLCVGFRCVQAQTLQ